MENLLKVSCQHCGELLLYSCGSCEGCLERVEKHLSAPRTNAHPLNSEMLVCSECGFVDTHENWVKVMVRDRLEEELGGMSDGDKADLFAEVLGMTIQEILNAQLGDAGISVEVISVPSHVTGGIEA